MKIYTVASAVYDSTFGIDVSAKVFSTEEEAKAFISKETKLFANNVCDNPHTDITNDTFTVYDDDGLHGLDMCIETHEI